MSLSWRLLTDGAVPHHRGLALDDALARCATDVSVPTLRLYTYTPCVLVGRFQRVPVEVNVEHCARFSVPINRRPSGGGTIIMGPDQLGIALIVPAKAEQFSFRSAQLMTQCASGLVTALAGLGIKAQFAGKNDLVTRNKKIAGLGLYQPHGGGRLFHASLLLDLDIEHMLQLLRTPFEASGDEGKVEVTKRITTIRAEIDRELSMASLVQRIKEGFESAFDVSFKAASVSEEENCLADELYRDLYTRDEWIYGSSAPTHDQVFQSSLRTVAGDLDVKAIVAGETVKSVFFGGNIIASDRAIHDLESSLRWHVCDPAALQHTVNQSVARNVAAWDRISAKEITHVLLQALGRPKDLGVEQTAGACFAREPAQVI